MPSRKASFLCRPHRYAAHLRETAMSRSNAVGLLLLASFLFGISSLNPSLAQTSVDLALVLAVDISPSMDVEEQELQRQGFVEAFRSPEVHNAVRQGSQGRIAVMYVEWAGAS